MSPRTTPSQTPKRKPDTTFRPQTLRERSPIVYWVAVIAVLCMILTSFAGVLLAF